MAEGSTQTTRTGAEPAKMPPKIDSSQGLNIGMGATPPMMTDTALDQEQPGAPPTVQESVNDARGGGAPSGVLDQAEREIESMMEAAKNAAEQSGANQLSAEKGKGNEELNPLEKEIMDKVKQFAIKYPYILAVLLFLKPIYSAIGEPWFGIILMYYLTGSSIVFFLFPFLTVFSWPVAALAAVFPALFLWMQFYSNRLEKYVKALLDIQISDLAGAKTPAGGKAAPGK